MLRGLILKKQNKYARELSKKFFFGIGISLVKKSP